MCDQSYRPPNLMLNLQLTIKRDRDGLEGAADRIMNLVQTLPFVQDDLDNL